MGQQMIHDFTAPNWPQEIAATFWENYSSNTLEFARQLRASEQDDGPWVAFGQFVQRLILAQAQPAPEVIDD